MDGRLKSSGVGWQSRRLTLALLRCWLTMQGSAGPGGASVRKLLMVDQVIPLEDFWMALLMNG